MRVVRQQGSFKIELDPSQAHRRGLALDLMLKAAAPERTRGATRGTHAHFNRVDDARQALVARALNVA